MTKNQYRLHRIDVMLGKIEQLIAGYKVNLSNEELLTMLEDYRKLREAVDDLILSDDDESARLVQSQMQT